MKSLIVAIKFLTIVPLARGMEVSERDMARSAGAFPLAGLLEGAALAVWAYIAALALPPSLVAALVLLAHVALGGAFHLDGLSDTFDAIAKRGDLEEKLRAMKDGASGAAGVSALVLSVLLKYVLLVTLAEYSSGAFYFALLMMPAFSKWTMVAAMFYGRPARPGGLGRIFIEGAGAGEFALATLTLLIAMTAGAASLGHPIPHKHLLNALSLLVLFGFTLLMLRLFKNQFGGQSGDTLGALGELSENLFMLLVATWSGLYTS